MESTSPSKLSDFEILGRLGSGSFGTVYKVRRKVDSLIYVLKAVIIEGMSTKEQLEAINEVKIMASLDHPNCVRYFDSFLDGGRLNIIMEYCNGGDLQLYLKRHSKEGLRVSEQRIWRVFLQIAVGLHYLHKQRVLHRDMKSANVFLCKDTSVKIGDLGVARVLGTNTNFAKTCVGTPYYLSPELCEDKPYNQKSDVWALGCILYECLTLKHPFDAKNQGALILKIIQGHYPPVSGSYSPEIRQLVSRLLSRDSRRRPFVVDLLALPVCVAKAGELGIELPPEVLEAATARARSRPGMLRKKTLTLNTGTSGSDGPQKPPSGRAASKPSQQAGNVRGTRVRGKGPGAGERRPRTKELSVEARTAAMASRRGSSKSVSSVGSDASAAGAGGDSRAPVRRPAPLKYASPAVADVEAVAALPDMPEHTPVDSPSPGKPMGSKPSGSRSRPSASDLAALTSTMSRATVHDTPTRVGEKDGHTGALERGDEADEFDAIMQAQFERDIAVSGSSRATPEKPAAPEAKVPEEAPLPPKPKKNVVHVKRLPPGVPKDFWDPVDPTKLPDLPAEVPEGFWEPHNPAADGGMATPATPAADVDVRISSVEISDSTADIRGTTQDIEFGGAHAVFVGVSGDASPAPSVTDDDGEGDGEDLDATKLDDDDDDGGDEGDDDDRVSPDAEVVAEELAGGDLAGMETPVPLSLEELVAEDARIRAQINHQQEECEKLLSPEVFDRLATLLTNHQDVDIDTLAAASDHPTKAAERITTELQLLDVHEYIAVYKLALYASKLRENAKQIHKRQHNPAT